MVAEKGLYYNVALNMSLFLYSLLRTFTVHIPLSSVCPVLVCTTQPFANRQFDHS